MRINEFKIRLPGNFYSGTLYDDRGRLVFDLGEAIEIAEDLYSGDWKEVYNGNQGITREEAIEQELI